MVTAKKEWTKKEWIPHKSQRSNAETPTKTKGKEVAISDGEGAKDETQADEHSENEPQEARDLDTVSATC